MSLSVGQVKNQLTSILHGTQLNQITDLDGMFDRAGRQLLLDIDPQETKRVTQFVNPIYNAVYDYAAPDDLKGNRIIDIRPQANRKLGEVLAQNYNQDFDLYKSSGTPNFTINFNKGIKTVRINAPFLLPGVTVNECDSLTDNGTWTATGDASNLTLDSVNFASGSASLKCNLSVGGTAGQLVNSTIQSVDLTGFEEGALFAYVYLPTGSDFTSVTARIGSSVGDYVTATVTTTSTGNAFQNGWNLLSFNRVGATAVGTIDDTKITYLYFSFAYNGTAQVGVRLDGVVARLGKILECEYYSKFLFSNALTGAWQETVTDDSNLINLDTESFNLFFDLLSFFALQSQQGMNAIRYDGPFFGEAYKRDLERYKAIYKSEIQKPQSAYYRRQPRGYGAWIGNMFNR